MSASLIYPLPINSCVTAAVQHAVSARGQENTLELPEQIKSILRDAPD
jgi:hypothetical protein